ncbi:MAG: hypothetical protein IJ819_04065 [Clostridiales bacterium]|nr:hypothetical protein [Clostridiales bacterium]
MKRIVCPKCGKTIEYDDKSIWEGNRDFEDVNCPNCDEFLTRVFTDGIVYPRIVDDE